MSAEHIIASNNKATRDFVGEVKNGEVPLSRVRRKLGKYKVRRAIEDLDSLAAQVSGSIRDRFDSALTEIGQAFEAIDADLKKNVCEILDDFSIIEITKKKHEGRLVDHVRLKKGVEISGSSKATVFKIKK